MKKSVLIIIISLLIISGTIAILLPKAPLSNEKFIGNNTRRNLALTQDQVTSNKNAVCNLLETKLGSGELVSDDQRKSWDNNKATLKDSRGGKNQLADYLKGDEAITPFIIQIVTYAGVFIVFTILSLLGWICYIFCCVCEKCCPPCKLCCKKRCTKQGSYKGVSLYWPPIGSAVFLLWIFVTCIVGLTYVNEIKDSFNTMICWALNALYGLNYGGGNFNGVAGIQKSLSDFSNQDLQNVIDSTKTTFSGVPEWTSKEKTELDYIADQMKIPCATGVSCAECTGQTYTGTKPASITVSCTAGSWDTYAVSSLNYSKKPNGVVSSTASLFFKSEVWGQQVDGVKTLYSGTVTAIVAAITGIEDAAKSINDQNATLKKTVDDGAKEMQKIVDLINDQSSSTYSFHSNNKQYLVSFTDGLTGLYWTFLWISVIAIVVGVLLFWRKLYFLRIFLHVFWCIFSFFMIFTFLLSAVFFIISMSGEQMCDVMDKMFNDRTEFESYTKLIGKDISDKIQICKKELNPVSGPFKGDDNLAKAFGIDEQLKIIDDLRTQINNFFKEAGSDSENFKTLQTVPNNIDILTANLNTLISTSSFQGVTDHTELKSTTDSVTTSMQACNAHINDKYVADKATCASGAYKSFTTAGVANTADDCFWIQDLYGASTRYNTCGALITSIGDMESWVAEKDKMANLKKEQTADLKIQLQQYINLQKSYIASVETFSNSVLAALDKIGGDDGILLSIKCFWFGTQLDLLYDALCVSFVNSVYNLAFVSAFFSFGMYFASFFLFMTARRVAHNKKEEGTKSKVDQGQKVGDYETSQ